jgi:hypothetical protein
MTVALRLAALGVTLTMIAAWNGVVVLGVVSPVFLPGPAATLAALWDGLLHGDLAALTVATIGRMFYGWIVASLVGILLGALIGTSRRAGVWLMPTLEVLRPLPASSLLPVGIALFGLTPGMLLATIAFSFGPAAVIDRGADRHRGRRDAHRPAGARHHHPDGRPHLSLHRPLRRRDPARRGRGLQQRAVGIRRSSLSGMATGLTGYT